MEGSSKALMMFLSDPRLGGDQRVLTSMNLRDRPFVHHLYWGDQWKDGGNFAQFIRPPAPIVNDISLTNWASFKNWVAWFKKLIDFKNYLNPIIYGGY